MRYKILSEYEGFRWIAEEYDECFTKDNIEGAVNFLITKGWMPLGGVSSASPGTYSYLVQAMIFPDPLM